MTRELLTALEENAECGMRNEESPSVGATFGRPQGPGRTTDSGRAQLAPTETEHNEEWGMRNAESPSVGATFGRPQGPDRTTGETHPPIPRRQRRVLPPEGEASASPVGGGVSEADGRGVGPEGSAEGEHNSELPIPNSALSGSAPDPELDALYRHFERLRAQTQALGREIPDFDPALALRDPDFLRLTAPGVGMDPRRAWLALHPELLERRAARESAAALARSLASSAARPREGGGGAGAALVPDYRSLPRAEQQRLKERILQAASRGEKIYP